MSGGSAAPPTTAVTVSPVLGTGTFTGFPFLTGTHAANCVPFIGPPFDVLAALTDAGRNLLARMLVEGLGFRVIGFRVGAGGYNPGAPIHPTLLDTTVTELDDPFFPVIALPPEPIDRYEQPNDQGASFLCRVASGEAVAALGEWGIYVEIIYSPLFPAEVGDRYLFALAHRPMIAKTLQDVLVWRLVVQY